jgi:hypothetical protein
MNEEETSKVLKIVDEAWNDISETAMSDIFLAPIIDFLDNELIDVNDDK